jgi:flagellar protein FlaI
MVEETKQVLDNAQPLFTTYKSRETPDIVSALMEEADESADEDSIDFGQFVPKAGAEADSE